MNIQRGTNNLFYICSEVYFISWHMYHVALFMLQSEASKKSYIFTSPCEFYVDYIFPSWLYSSQMSGLPELWN